MLDSGNISSFDNSKKWDKYTGLARMGGSATSASFSIGSAGTNVNSFANAFTGARMTESLTPNGSMGAGFVGGVAIDWTTSGIGTFTEETTEVRSGGSSQKIEVTGSNEARFISGAMSLRSGVSYLLSGYIKIESTDNNKPVKLWFNTGNETFSQTISAQTNLQETNTDWQAFQFVVTYDDLGGAINALTVEVRGATTCYVDDVYCIPLVRAGLENPQRLCLQEPLDLSGSAELKFVHAGSERNALYVSHATIMYPEATRQIKWLL